MILFAVFIGLGLWRWAATGHVFFLYNFGYIGFAILIGHVLSEFLPREQRPWGRRVTQLLIGSYMLGFLGMIAHENMQVEGFFFYLFGGAIGGALLHYLVAKLAGPLYFGRAWCAWACWTAMVLDFLPWKRPKRERVHRAEWIRLAHFLIVLATVAYLFFATGYRPSRNDELTWLLAGNVLYYSVALLLAVVLHDNRAFCKYVCPIPITLKMTSPFAVLKQEILPERCTRCGLCELRCPMDIKLLSYMQKGSRITSTECILCNTCIHVCPEGAIETTSRFGLR